MDTVSVRYIVNDVETSADFYTHLQGFDLEMNPGGGFAVVSRGPLRMFLNQPGAGGAGQAMPDGTLPEPGGWNRVQIKVDDLQATVAALQAAGARFRNEIVTGRGGLQVLLDDPSGNPVELFQLA
jgi:catechol 2,3-dioxygenase-like lactoylglutathione lyase family enzyme